MNREIRVTKHSTGRLGTPCGGRLTAESRSANKAFTLIELVVAIGILGMMFLFAGVIFKTSIEAYRTAGANAEIMQKLRAITDQLNRDFKGLRKDAPLFIHFRQRTNYPIQRYDQIMFFANGDFQSTQLYDSSSGEPDEMGDMLVTGNIARIYYGQATLDSSYPWYEQGDDKRERILARRQHILTADPDLDRWPDADSFKISFSEKTGGVYKNELYEHDRLSLSLWKTFDRDIYKDQFSLVLFDKTAFVNMDVPNTFHKLICSGVSDFTIQWAYWDPTYGKFFWFPSDNPDGDILTADSHFDIMDKLGAVEDMFGVFLGIPGCSRFGDWFPIGDVEYKSGDYFSSNFYPKAFKFTFTLYDSKGIIKNSRTFTHIVYLGD